MKKIFQRTEAMERCLTLIYRVNFKKGNVIFMNLFKTMKDSAKRNYIRIFQKFDLEDYIHYIGGGTYLPPPLSKEDEDMYISSINDEKSRQILIEHNLRLVVYIAKKFENTNICVDDLISIGTIGLIKAINTFKSDKKIKLATYASRCIENEILMYLRKNNSQKSVISFDEPLNVDWDGNELLLGDILGTDEDSIDRHLEEEVEKQLLISAMNNLCQREKQIMEMRYGLCGKTEKTQKEVADLLGISQSYISRLEKRIIRRLRNDIARNI